MNASTLRIFLPALFATATAAGCGDGETCDPAEVNAEASDSDGAAGVQSADCCAGSCVEGVCMEDSTCAPLCKPLDGTCTAAEDCCSNYCGLDGTCAEAP